MRTNLRVFLFVTLALAPAAAWADGAFFGPFGWSIWEYGQIAFLDWNETTATETLAILPQFEGDAREFAWVVPVPAVPQVAAGDRRLFSELFELTSPLYNRRDSSWDCESGSVDYDGAGEPEDVEIVWHDLVDIYDVIVVQAQSASALTDSLTAWGYLHEGNQEQAGPLIADYVARGWSFAAMTIDSTAFAATYPPQDYDGFVYGGLRPIELTFAAVEPVYPLRLSALSASRSTRVVLFVAADHRQQWPGADVKYANRFRDPEYDALTGRYPRVASRLRPNGFLTCLQVDLAPQDMTDDIVLTRAPEDDEFRRIEYGGFSTFGVFLLASTVIWVVSKARRLHNLRR